MADIPRPCAGATNFAGQEDDDDKPVLLTAFLGSARTIGFDVDDANPIVRAEPRNAVSRTGLSSSSS
jgi:hypothetical protein